MSFENFYFQYLKSSTGLEGTNMQVIEREVHKIALLVGDVRSEIFTAYDIPAFSLLSIQFSFHYPCHFTIFLRLRNAR